MVSGYSTHISGKQEGRGMTFRVPSVSEESTTDEEASKEPEPIGDGTAPVRVSLSPV